METERKKDFLVAFIPLRGGSKSIPLKNIKDIAGRPLAFWVIEAALGCAEIDRVFVSTDSIAIRKALGSIAHPKLEVISRSKTTATDSASTESAMLEFAKRHVFSHIVLIQATSPLLESRHLKAGIAKYTSYRYDSLLSLVRQKRFVWEESRGIVKPLNYNPLRRPFRQQFKGFLVENGAFYITSKRLLLKTGCRISGKVGFYEMPEESYFELDEPADWVITEGFLRKKQASLFNKALVKHIKIFGTDVDGVLTNGKVLQGPRGEQIMQFHRRDGMGMELLRERGIIPVILTREKSTTVLRRARKLKVAEVHIGVIDKVVMMGKILKKHGFSWKQFAYIGDDINDSALLKKAGFCFVPTDAVGQVRKDADYITNAKGGEGAFREAVDFLLS